MKKVPDGIWNGRVDHHTNRSSFRIHQIIELVPIEDLNSADQACVIVGFASDEGVLRNKGQLGAAKAPNELRKELAKLPWMFPEDKRLVDVGTVECIENKLEQAQENIGTIVSTVLAKNGTPIILGGGHETTFGHYSGVRKFIGKDASLGIINIDAHFDLRPYDEQTSSGTMFRQMLETDPNCNYFVLGIQRFGNTKELFDKADELRVEYVYEDQMSTGNTESVLNDFIDKHDYILLTLCTDVLNAAFAPGVSAPSPFGLDPKVVRSIIQTVASNDKTLSFDISEVNPLLDESNRTVKLGAYLINEAIISFLDRK